jgi:hypothetical protein
MRRREFLPVFAIAANVGLSQSKAARRGVHVSNWDGLPSRAELRALGLEVFERAKQQPDFSRSTARSHRLRKAVLTGKAIESDCFRAAASGAGVEIELTPQNLNATVALFRRLAELDPWMDDSAPIVDMALLGDSPSVQGMLLAVQGMLLDLHEQFETIDADDDYSAYRLLIVTSKPDPMKLEAYRKFGGSVYTPPAGITREAFAEALRKYVPKPAVIAPGLPAEAEVTFLERRTPGGIRRVGHVLYYPDDKPGVLENVQLSFRLPQHPLGVITIPDQRPVEFVHNEFLTTFTLPKVTGHQAIAFE